MHSSPCRSGLLRYAVWVDAGRVDASVPTAFDRSCAAHPRAQYGMSRAEPPNTAPQGPSIPSIVRRSPRESKAKSDGTARARSRSAYRAGLGDRRLPASLATGGSFSFETVRACSRLFQAVRRGIAKAPTPLPAQVSFSKRSVVARARQPTMTTPPLLPPSPSTVRYLAVSRRPIIGGDLLLDWESWKP
ncbi:hypothetical protein K431DRAFT_284053 [Polychaeton citri CBS 116435]|uniref:Uncharacterized protein n=1 Tax=Polychaeton citri CBS 116435 TaxID=1314669 RepID=A0A9P4QCE6_9PEZI|nr:hypothetical protein K431DRAFT_284053 [Polychaeton citri CBS 116435]